MRDADFRKPAGFEIGARVASDAVDPRHKYTFSECATLRLINDALSILFAYKFPLLQQILEQM